MTSLHQQCAISDSAGRLKAAGEKKRAIAAAFAAIVAWFVRDVGRRQPKLLFMPLRFVKQRAMRHSRARARASIARYRDNCETAGSDNGDINSRQLTGSLQTFSADKRDASRSDRNALDARCKQAGENQGRVRPIVRPETTREVCSPRAVAPRGRPEYYRIEMRVLIAASGARARAIAIDESANVSGAAARFSRDIRIYYEACKCKVRRCESRDPLVNAGRILMPRSDPRTLDDR